MPLWWVNADGVQDTQVCGVTEPVGVDGEANVVTFESNGA